MRRRVVKAFIQADPVSITVTRPGGVVETAAGGRIRNAPTILLPQQARIVQNKRRYTAGIVNSEAGDIPHTDYLLIAEHTKDFKENDTFEWQNEHYRILGIYALRTESILAGIVMLGNENRGE